MKNVIYIVMGSTGEYSDKSEWLVKAFDSEDAAESFAHHLNDNLVSLGVCKYQDPNFNTYYENRDLIEKTMRQQDPEFQLDYTGTNYIVVAVERG